MIRVLFKYLFFIYFTSLTDKTYPLALLILFNRDIYFQNLDLAKTPSLAKTLMAYT